MREAAPAARTRLMMSSQIAACPGSSSRRTNPSTWTSARRGSATCLCNRAAPCPASARRSCARDTTSGGGAAVSPRMARPMAATAFGSDLRDPTILRRIRMTRKTIQGGNVMEP